MRGKSHHPLSHLWRAHREPLLVVRRLNRGRHVRWSLGNLTWADHHYLVSVHHPGPEGVLVWWVHLPDNLCRQVVMAHAVLITIAENHCARLSSVGQDAL